MCFCLSVHADIYMENWSFGFFTCTYHLFQEWPVAFFHEILWLINVVFLYPFFFELCDEDAIFFLTPVIFKQLTMLHEHFYHKVVQYQIYIYKTNVPGIFLAHVMSGPVIFVCALACPCNITTISYNVSTYDNHFLYVPLFIGNGMFQILVWQITDTSTHILYQLV